MPLIPSKILSNVNVIEVLLNLRQKKIQNRLTGDEAAIKSHKLEAGRQETMYTADPRNLNPNPESRKSTCLALYPLKAQESVVAGTSGNNSENEI